MVSLSGLLDRVEKVASSPRRTHGSVSSESLRTHNKVPSEIPWPLEFWNLERGNRERLINNIMPYMAGSLRRDPVQRFREEFVWAREFVDVEGAAEASDSVASFRGSIETFRDDPEGFIDDLARLTSFVFFAILRYCYRIRFLGGRKASYRHLKLIDLDVDRDGYYKPHLSEQDVYRLTRIRNQYGSFYYKKRHTEAMNHSAWMAFSARLQSFCHLYISRVAEDPETNLARLDHDLPRIRREWGVDDACHHRECEFNDTGHEGEGMHSETREPSVRVDGDFLDARSGSMERMPLTDGRLVEVKDGTAGSTPPISSLGERPGRGEPSTAISAAHRSPPESQVGEVDSRSASSTPRLDSLENGVEEPRRDIQEGRHQIGSLADMLMMVRWLLEHLPSTKSNSDTKDWKRFFNDQWEKRDREDHPFNGLGEEFCRDGKKLYNTISDRFHTYGTMCDEEMSERVQILVDRIKPKNFIGNKIDLEAEKQRWEITP